MELIAVVADAPICTGGKIFVRAGLLQESMVAMALGKGGVGGGPRKDKRSFTGVCTEYSC